MIDTNMRNAITMFTTSTAGLVSMGDILPHCLYLAYKYLNYFSVLILHDRGKCPLQSNDTILMKAWALCGIKKNSGK